MTPWIAAYLTAAFLVFQFLNLAVYRRQAFQRAYETTCEALDLDEEPWLQATLFALFELVLAGASLAFPITGCVILLLKMLSRLDDP